MLLQFTGYGGVCSHLVTFERRVLALTFETLIPADCSSCMYGLGVKWADY